MLVVRVKEKLASIGIDNSKKWIIFHAGVSEPKRQYPVELWVQTAKAVIAEKGYSVLFSGAHSEKQLCDELALQTGEGSQSLAGLFNLEEFIALIKLAPLLVSVNTGPVHIAAAVNTAVIVLYAQTNPQHAPWMVNHKVLEFEVPREERSKNEVIQFLYKEVYRQETLMPGKDQILLAIEELLNDNVL